MMCDVCDNVARTERRANRQNISYRALIRIGGNNIDQIPRRIGGVARYVLALEERFRIIAATVMIAVLIA